ncbi:hypothetical protein N9Q82_04220 [Gammaproteobacteria bacterium]|nr:hypothetical protein [Gammaproteobacteria bacterium]
MKKYLYLYCFLSIIILADDLDLGADFSAGGTITASEFNSKFNMLEKTSRLVKDSDLIGTWNCRSVHHYENSPFTQFDGGFLYYLDGDITFSESNQDPSVTSPKSWSSDLEMIYDSNETSGTYSLFANILITRVGDSSDINGELAEIDFTSEDQLRFKWRSGGGSLTVNYSLCNKAS